MIVPGEGFLLPSSRAQGLWGGGGVDEIGTCICHRHVKSDIARPRSVDQVIHASLKMCRIFPITKQLWIKPILSVVQLVRLCQCSPAGRFFQEKRGTAVKVRGR